MVYLKDVLSGLAAIYLGLLFPSVVNAFRGIAQEKATGFAVVTGGILEALFSPLFWILAIGFAALFFWAGQLQSRILRVTLFWLPVVLILVVGLSLTVLVGYAFLRFHRG